jgi:hypothetical protein
MLFSLLLLAAALGMAAAGGAGVTGRQGSGDDGALSGDKPEPRFTDGQGGKGGPEGAAQRLARIETKWTQLQTRFTVENSQQTAPLVQSIRDQLAKARELLASGNYQAADMACNIIDNHIETMLGILNNNALKQYQGGASGPGGDPQRMLEDMKNGAEIDIQRDDAKLAYFSQLLSVSKNPRAAETLDKVRALLDKARMEISADRPAAARLLLSQVEPLFFELQRLVQEVHSAETQQAQDAARDAYKDQQPGSRTGLAQATEVFRRVQERATRAKEQARSADNPKATAANARIQELLDKSKEALGSGQAEAAKEYALKAEGMLAELHRSANAGDARLSPAAWQRLQAKLDRAAEIVAASRSDKAARILEKGKEHFERAQRSHAEGQASRAEVEMDLALKLAAKAVDIARSGPR